MKCRILYRSHTKLTDQHVEVPSLGQHVTPLYVRQESVDAPSLCDAIDLAKPMEGEKLVNTLPL